MRPNSRPDDAGWPPPVRRRRQQRPAAGTTGPSARWRRLCGQLGLLLGRQGRQPGKDLVGEGGLPDAADPEPG